MQLMGGSDILLTNLLCSMSIINQERSHWVAMPTNPENWDQSLNKSLFTFYGGLLCQSTKIRS